MCGAGVAHAGYTHYWRWRSAPDAAELRAAVADMNRIAKARPGEVTVESNGASITLNGIGDDGHEDFRFPAGAFCKTAAKPCDEVVTACLLVARDHCSRKARDRAEAAR